MSTFLTNHLPTWEEHVEFIKNNTYQSWDIIWVDNVRIGNIYLTDRDEIGIFLDKKFQFNGYGSIAINEL